jgi:nucleotide-binding universal stress UspA family protein
MKSFQHILVPIDIGDDVPFSVAMALGMARKFDARITLVHAFDLTPFLTTGPFAPPIDVEPVVAAAEKCLKSAKEKISTEWPKTEAVFQRGRPGDTILEVAKTHGCDLIVIGTHGRRGIARVLMGSVAERVVRLSPIPVLTVHPDSA